MIYHVCDWCAVVLANADTSHLDAEQELIVDANIDAIGSMLAYVGPYKNGGYWDCPICEETTIGDGSSWETV